MKEKSHQQYKDCRTCILLTAKDARGLDHAETE